jgi:activator of the mannose operon (transcriptional antiterminator)
MISRTRLRHIIGDIKKEETLLLSREWAISREILEKAGGIFALSFSPLEVSYLAMHMAGGKRRQHHKEKLDSNELLEPLLEQLIKRTSELTFIDFTMDKELRKGLGVHVYTLLNRLKYSLSVENPMLQDIKKMYPYMFYTMIYVMEELNQRFSLAIPEEEAAYLTLYFQTSIERLQRHDGKKKMAVVVCHMGIGMSQLLRTKLERKFHSLLIEDCIARAELSRFLSDHDIDLIISTVALPKIEMPAIVVSPLLTKEEELELQAFMKKLDGTQTYSVLAGFTDASLVCLQLDFGHRYEVIEHLANVLYTNGFVEKEYAHNAIVREKMSPTTIGAGIAIPHGNPALIQQSAIAIGTLKEPIEWEGEWVSLVFMLAAKNNGQKETRQLFAELSHISEEPDLIQALVHETKAERFLALLQT